MANGDIGPCASRLRSVLPDIQYGRAADLNGWMQPVVLDDH
jgi:hypothetical protein